MKPCIFQRIADLDNLVVKSESKKNERAVILCHGYGANFEDLASLAEVLDPSGAYDWFFPNAPLELNIAPGYVGRAWFPIDMMRLQMALMQGLTQPLENELPEGFPTASQGLESMIKTLASEYKEFVVGGFSQGSMVTTDLALNSSLNIRALLLLSSNMIAKSRYVEALHLRQARGLNRFRIFQSHGARDPILPKGGADSLYQFWLNEGFEPEYETFMGGHEIPYSVLEKLKVFLKKLD